MKCPYCNLEHPDTAAFCPTSGKRLVRETEISCPNCGRRIRIDARFCSYCQHSMQESSGLDTPISTHLPDQIGHKRRINLLLLFIGVVGLVLLVLGGILIWGDMGMVPTQTRTAQRPFITITPTNIPIKSRHASSTPTDELKLNPTSKVNIIPTVVLTDTMTAVPTNTIKPKNTSTELHSCPGSEPQRVMVDDKVMVCTKSDRVFVRQQPQIDGFVYFRIYPGTETLIIDGPVCADNSSWWKVKVAAGIKVYKGSDYFLTTDQEGWLREGSDEVDRYFICPVTK